MVNNPGCVVTKLQFSELFSQAWLKAICPETIINGFRKTGVCPLNQDAIEISEDVENLTSLSQSMDSDSYPSSSSTPPPVGNNNEPSTSFSQSNSNLNSLVSGYVPIGESSVETLHSPFTADQMEKFQKHVDHGYDLFIEEKKLCCMATMVSSSLFAQ